MEIQHHGAINGVTGSCHQLHIDEQNNGKGHEQSRREFIHVCLFLE